MLLTPENIQNQQFHVRFRGFDVDEVDAFLEKVAENYLVLVKDNEKLRDAMAAVQGERDQIQSQERTFKNAIIAAQNIADEMQSKAKQEAHVLKENARLEAAAMLDAAKEQEIALKQQISSLLLEKQKLKDDLHSFLMAHVNRLDSQYPSGTQADSLRQTPVEKSAPQPSIIGDIGKSRKAASEPQKPAAVSPPPVKAQKPIFREIPDELPMEDLADLYEKIDLSEIGDDGLVEQQATPKKAATTYATNGLDDLDLSMPDLDGDMLFSLDDPLDDPLGPKMDIDPLAHEK
ncbi:MAG: DivIVA domain-containing protein [Proteobacteria bacterium]|nr:DivIVA domain-containing protein [Pseudomonadota bacterium]MBU1641216.1 DivIVA domain-containing protein [Pseudomonadota bacterium]